jgi:uncharacterized protein (TIGR02996 family)
LYSPIWENPRDTSRRQVLADLLLERGDPRGEFISLQLAHASPKRQRTLINTHGRAWLGALADILDLKEEPPVFEDGFVTEVSIKHVRQAQFLLAGDAPEWATVRRVRRGLQRFTRAMVGLEHSGPVKLDALKALVRDELPLALRSVEVNAFPDEAVEVLEQLASPPSWLALHFDVFEPTRELRDALPRLTELPGLSRLRFSAEAAEVMPALLGQMGLDWLPRTVTRVELRDEERLIILERDRKSWSLNLTDLGDRLVHVNDWKDLLAELQWLQPTAVRLSVLSDVDAEEVKQVEHRAGRFGLPVSLESLEAVPSELAW